MIADGGRLMHYTPLPSRALALQAVLSRRAVEAVTQDDYYALSDMAHGALLLAPSVSSDLCSYLLAISEEAAAMAEMGGNHD